MTDMPAATNGEPLVDKRVELHGETGELRGDLVIDTGRIKAGDPGRARLRVTDAQGKPFKKLEPVMATFAHLVAFHEDRKTVLHIHPKGAEVLLPSDRGGPELEFQVYATEPGYYRLFAQVQVAGEAKFIPFGITVEP
jgi:hypothetical protein